MDEKAVVVFEQDEIFKIKQIIMDGEATEAILMLKKIIKRVEESENKNLKLS